MALRAEVVPQDGVPGGGDLVGPADGAVVRRVVEALGIGLGLLQDLQEDLGADSLDVVDLLMSIEDEFDVEVPDEEIENIKTVGALVAYIEANS